MSNSLLIVARFAVYLQLTRLYAQSIYRGNDFICDSTNNLKCHANDNIICNDNKVCTLICNDGCNGVIINGKKAKSLSIRNCINCDNMIVYCPQNGPYGDEDICNLELSNNVHNVHIYAQEGFHDFNLTQSQSDSFNYNIVSSSIHCGDLSMIEFQCKLSNDGSSCTDLHKKCQNYHIPTPSPTVEPTEITSLPTLSSPTSSPTDNKLIINQYTKTREINKSIITTEAYDDDDDDESNNKNKNGTIGLFKNNNDPNLHYIMLIVGLCIIWGSFFCCFIIMYYHHIKKQELQKTVSIIQRPMSPTFGPSYQPSKSAITQLKPSHDYQFSMDSALAKKMQLAPPSKTQTHTEVNELYKVKSLSTIIQVNLNQEREQKEKKEREEKEDTEPIVVDVIPVLSPRPYFYDSHHNGNITPVSPQRYTNRPVLADAHSNPMSSINTSEAVEIKLPSSHQQKNQETPQFDADHDIDDIQLDDEDDDDDDKKQSDDDNEDEGSLDSKYILSQSMKVKNKENIEDKEEEEEEEDIIQTEGDDKSLRECVINGNKWKYSAAPPPPPPPTLANDSMNDIPAIKGIHGINGGSIISPSRHYRVKYSLGIQQDIKNCWSVPGAVAADKKFIFDEKAQQRVRAQSISSNLLKPPISPNNGHNGNYYDQYTSITPQPVPQLAYLAFPQNRPRIYSDPIYPVKQSK